MVNYLFLFSKCFLIFVGIFFVLGMKYAVPTVSNPTGLLKKILIFLDKQPMSKIGSSNTDEQFQLGLWLEKQTSV